MPRRDFVKKIDINLARKAKRATCPKCGTRFDIQCDSPEPPVKPAPPPRPPATNSTAKKRVDPPKQYPPIRNRVVAESKEKKQKETIWNKQYGRGGCLVVLIGLIVVGAFVARVIDLNNSYKETAAKSKASPTAKSRSKPTPRPKSTYTPEEYYTNGGYLAAITEELYDKAVGYQVQGDNQALISLMSTGYVIILKPGVRVHVEKFKMFSGTVKIRPHGSTLERWTAYEAIRKNG